MSSRARFDTGIAAEDTAARLYEGEGARILARRARTPAGEIDLILAEAGEVVFVEVKARKTFAAAKASLSARQQARLYAAAEVWLGENGHSSLTPCRFDLVVVDATGAPSRIKAAFGI